METVQLSYFLFACQFLNHAEAARSAGLSASTLSESIDALERELGLALFKRGRLGHYPTEAALWLHQAVEPLLQTIEVVETLFARCAEPVMRSLEVVSLLQFTAGGLSRAASLAIRSLARTEPGVIGATRFALAGRVAERGVGNASAPDHNIAALAGEGETGSPPGNALAQELGEYQGFPERRTGPKPSRVVIDYAPDLAASGDVLLFEDRWVAVSRSQHRPGEPPGPLSPDQLRDATLLLPALGSAQMRQARHYCRAHDLPDPQAVAEDIGVLAWLERSVGKRHLLAPHSLIAASAARSTLAIRDLPYPLTTPVVARADAEDPVGQRYVEHLTAVLGMPAPALFRPAVSLKQLRSFRMLAEHRNITLSALAVGTTQSAMSRQLRKLEDTLGLQLFERRQTGLRPLPAAASLIRILRPALEALDGIAAAAPRYSPAGRERLTIGLPPMADHEGPLASAVSGAVAAWLSRHPGVEARFVEGSTEALGRGVKAGEINLALVEAQISRSWQADLDAEEAFGLVTSGARTKPATESVALSEALREPPVLLGPSFGLRRLLDDAAAELGLRVVPRMEINALPMLLALVRRMDLVTILPRSSVGAFLSSGAFRFTPIRDPVITARLSILFPTDRSLTQVERDLIASLRRHLGRKGPPTAPPLSAATASA